jgi:hypothetical protein
MYPETIFPIAPICFDYPGQLSANRQATVLALDQKTVQDYIFLHWIGQVHVSRTFLRLKFTGFDREVAHSDQTPWVRLTAKARRYRFRTNSCV